MSVDVAGARRVSLGALVVGVVVAFTASLLTVVGAPPALAHAQISGSSPRDGAVLKKAPRSLTLNFSERVTFSPANVQLLSSTATQVPVRVSTKTVNGKSRVMVKPVRPLGAGRYAARYSVTSADGHVITGAFAFSVNASSPRAVSQSRTLSDGTRAVLSGAKVGSRSITLTTFAKSGVVELSHPSLGAPLRWKVTGNGKSAKASGILPFAGTWSVTARLRVSQFKESVGTGSFVVTS